MQERTCQTGLTFSGMTRRERMHRVAPWSAGKRREHFMLSGAAASRTQTPPLIFRANAGRSLRKEWAE
jgi:hypothetical protein